MDTKTKSISPEKIELLKIIAIEIVNRLKISKVVAGLQSEIKKVKEKQWQVAHDIRGPIGGIIWLAQAIKEDGDKNNYDDLLEIIQVIQKSGNSLLELAEEILSEEKPESSEPKLNPDQEYNLVFLKEKLTNLYGVQGNQKK
jgi:signal transduction histidine kinase